MSQSVNNNDRSLKTYTYSYDALNRITKGIFNVNTYSLMGISYDKNGNITSLQRNKYNGNDNFGYTYSGNQLISLTGTDPGNYSYDGNGNMITDSRKNITGIDYNHLNLATNIAINGGNIQYIYDAIGIKQRKIVNDNGNITETEYAGNYIYKNGILQFSGHPEGYLKSDGNGGFEYVFQYKDHLGNVRLAYADSDGNGSISASTEIIGENNYYPGGLLHKGYNNIVSSNGNPSAEKYKFQGQELEEEFGKDTYAYQWRDYDPATLRFNKIDRFSEKYYDYSPYHFSKNNPIMYREIAGDSVNLAKVQIYDNANNTNHQQTIINDLQAATGLTLSIDSNTGLLGYATDANGNAIISTTTDADGNVVQNGSASARADLVGFIDGNGIIDVGISPDRSVTSRSQNDIYLGESQMSSFINGTPAALNSRTMGYGMVLMHEFNHTNAGGSLSDPTDPTNTSATGPVVDRVNVYRNELDNNPSNAGARPYGQRQHYYAVPSGSNSSVRFSYPTTNSRGRAIRRTTRIIF